MTVSLTFDKYLLRSTCDDIDNMNIIIVTKMGSIRTENKRFKSPFNIFYQYENI